MPHSVLVVDDDETIRETLSDVLQSQGHGVTRAGSGQQALDLLAAQNFHLVLLDIRLPDIDGIEILRRLRRTDDHTLVVIITAYPEVRGAVEALKAGAHDYVIKPFELEDIKSLVRRALETHRLRSRMALVRNTTGTAEPLEGLIGESPKLLEVVEAVRLIAAAPRAPVLVRGESGTGKEHVAEAVHRLSDRSEGPWVTLNCSAIPENLLESEMFGHEKGAFTDAGFTKLGLMELADGGTLFLDEIGDLSRTIQPKLLRAIETQKFRRLGSSREIAVDVRFVAASNRDLDAMVRSGDFREDLYYRLNVASIDVPPLRERRTDIVPLASHFLSRASRTMGVAAADFDPAVFPLLEAYNWPGNVRELRNVVERALILCRGQAIGADDLPKELTAGAPADTAPGDAVGTLAEVERQHISRALLHHGGNKSAAARALGITRGTLRNKMRSHGLDGEDR